jgi:hypothetical protein
MTEWIRKSLLAAALIAAPVMSTSRAFAQAPTTAPSDKEDAEVQKAKQDVERAQQELERALERSPKGAQTDRARLEVQRALEHAHALAGQSDAIRRAYTFALPGGKKEKVAFLGVVTTPAGPELRENLGLQRGVGLVVQSVEKDSAADKAGLQRYDILMKLDDQLLINSQQLGVLVRLHKNGDEVNLTVRRKGQEQQIKAALNEKETYVSDAGDEPGFGAFAATPAVTAIAPVPPSPIRARVNNNTANVIHTDDQMTLELGVKNDSKHLKATDKDGKVLFDGPIDNDDQRKGIPDAVATRLTKLESNLTIVPDAVGGMRVRVNGDGE